MQKTYQFIIGLLLFTVLNTVQAAEGYRYMHVTIDTPWAIFLFLLVIVLFPFVLMAILYWYFAFKSAKEKGKIANPVEEDPATSATGNE
jgi:predicted membrane protein